MKLPIQPPYLPMEAEPASMLPLDGDWQYEPKWAGMRCLIFRDGDEVELQARSGQLVTQQFSEFAQELRALDARRFVLDGNIIVAENRTLLVVFDMLVTERSTLLVQRMLIERRSRLERFASRHFTESGPLAISPRTADLDVAKEWLISLPAAGVVAKDTEAPYLSGRSSKWLAL